jgi:hypothetical protein
MECHICYEIFKDPRLLDCGHTFCFKCIDRLLENNSLACPICRSPILLTDNWRPRRNFQLASMIRELKIMQSEALFLHSNGSAGNREVTDSSSEGSLNDFLLESHFQNAQQTWSPDLKYVAGCCAVFIPSVRKK